jgi:transcription initiation factor TFIIIB Brf1 subunit/transcription initiation factor TFIIB
MSEDALFRWNFTLKLACNQCKRALFVEEVATEEIFCTICGKQPRNKLRLGYLVARSRQEWPENWDEFASRGNLASEKSWIDVIPIAEPRNDPEDSAEPDSPPPCSMEDIDSPEETSLPSPSLSDRTPSKPDDLAPHRSDAEILALCDELSLPVEVATEAKRILLIASPRLPVKPNIKPSPAVLRACLFVACRQLGIVKTFNEFETDLPTQLRRKDFHKQFKHISLILKKFKIEFPPNTPNSPTNPSLLTPPLMSPTTSFQLSFTIVDFINHEAKAMGLSDAIRDRAVEICQHPNVENLFLGKRPSSWAAIVLSFAAECEECYLGTAPYAEAANVSLSTLTHGQKAMWQVVKDLGKTGTLPPAFRAQWNYIPNENGDKGTPESVGHKIWHIETV